MGEIKGALAGLVIGALACGSVWAKDRSNTLFGATNNIVVLDTTGWCGLAAIPYDEKSPDGVGTDVEVDWKCIEQNDKLFLEGKHETWPMVAHVLKAVRDGTAKAK